MAEYRMYPTEAAEVRQGNFMMIQTRPCQVVNVSVSDGNCSFTGIDIFTGDQHEDTFLSTDMVDVPAITNSDFTIAQIEEDSGQLTVMDQYGSMKDDLYLPTYPQDLADQIRQAWNGGENSVIVTVKSALGQQQVVGFRLES